MTAEERLELTRELVTYIDEKSFQPASCNPNVYEWAPGGQEAHLSLPRLIIVISGAYEYARKNMMLEAGESGTVWRWMRERPVIYEKVQAIFEEARSGASDPQWRSSQ
jgi:hypothetical protein